MARTTYVTMFVQTVFCLSLKFHRRRRKKMNLSLLDLSALPQVKKSNQLTHMILLDLFVMKISLISDRDGTCERILVHISKIQQGAYFYYCMQLHS